MLWQSHRLCVVQGAISYLAKTFIGCRPDEKIEQLRKRLLSICTIDEAEEVHGYLTADKAAHTSDQT